jgi:hypothetical protein
VRVRDNLQLVDAWYDDDNGGGEIVYMSFYGASRSSLQNVPNIFRHVQPAGLGGVLHSSRYRMDVQQPDDMRVHWHSATRSLLEAGSKSPERTWSATNVSVKSSRALSAFSTLDALC